MIADYKNPFSTSGPVSNWTYLADIKNISNTYPYGKSYGTNAIYNAEDDYRYGFNGMEKEKNISSSGNTFDFGARVYDSEFPIFGKPDPLESKFPYKSPYIMASNNPIWAIDVEGETTFYIFGTNQVPEDNDNTKIRATVDYLHNTLSASTGPVDYGFDWSEYNGQFNDQWEREQAAKLLAKYIIKNNKKGDDITIIGFSYGGAVGIMAADIVYRKTGQKVNLITVATPANNYVGSTNLDNYANAEKSAGRTLYEYTKQARAGNPEYTSGINSMIHFYMDEDGVAGGLAYDDYYKSKKVNNYMLNTEGASWYNGISIPAIESHMYIMENIKVFINTIKEYGIVRQKPTGSSKKGKTDGKPTK